MTENVTMSDTAGGIVQPQSSGIVSGAEVADPTVNAPVGNPANIDPTVNVNSLPAPQPVIPSETQPDQSPSQLAPEQEPGFVATAEDITDLVLVTGQSNALGAGTAYDEFLDAPNNRVMAYTNSGWQVANLNQVWDLNWFPRNDPDTPPSNNFSLHFGKRVAARAPDRVVGFILLTAPGSPISHWDRDSDFFNQIRSKVSQAINELPYKSRIDGILWHQGETDDEDRDQYSTALYDLIQRFRSEPWFDDGLPFICGDTAASPVNNQLRRLNTDADPWTACIAAEGLAVIPETTHFSAASLRTLGQRYGDVYVEMMLGD